MNYYLLIICCRTADAVLRSNTLGAHQRAVPNRLPTHTCLTVRISDPRIVHEDAESPLAKLFVASSALCVTLIPVSPHPSISPRPLQKGPCFTEMFQTSPGLTSCWMNESGQPVRGAESCCVLLIAARRRSDESGRKCAERVGAGGGVLILFSRVCLSECVFPVACALIAQRGICICASVFCCPGDNIATLVGRPGAT